MDPREGKAERGVSGTGTHIHKHIHTHTHTETDRKLLLLLLNRLEEIVCVQVCVLS